MDLITFLSVLLTGVALSMDAFAVSVCKGLTLGDKADAKSGLTVGAWFGIFQALMPLIGYYAMHLVITFLSDTPVNAWVEALDHFIACGILAYIGINMIREASGEEDGESASLGFKAMLILAVATSIDALATGMAMRMEGEINIWLSVLIIGLTTFTLSFIGLKAGSYVGQKFSSKAQIAGGAVLILLGVKIVIEHLFFA